MPTNWPQQQQQQQIIITTTTNNQFRLLVARYGLVTMIMSEQVSGDCCCVSQASRKISATCSSKQNAR